jgi:capping protein alpha
LVLSSHNFNYKNFWTGEWLSIWEINKKDGGFELNGKIRLSTYYYEEGNVQFKLNKEYNQKIDSKGENETTAQEIITIINNLENNIQIELDLIYDSLSDEYLKPLRRRMPITGQKMNWSLNQIAFTK